MDRARIWQQVPQQSHTHGIVLRRVALHSIKFKVTRRVSACRLACPRLNQITRLSM